METSVSLLERLRTQADDAAWQRLDQVYRPLIRSWVLRDPDLRQDTEDLVQDVMAVLVRELPIFERRRVGSFRAWLRTITVRRVLAHRRALAAHKKERVVVDHGVLKDLEDERSELSRLWDQEHDRHVIAKLLQMAEGSFQASTVRAFRRLVLDEAAVAAVSAELNMSANAVLLAKSRVLSWLRREASGLID